MESIFARLLHTPLSDLLRGQITGSLNWRQILASAELPPEIQSLVSNVVASTRLGRKDKLEVALELLCHFDDGLLAGATTEQLVQAFGDPRQAAQLIRRSRIRAYSLRRQIVRFALPAFALFLILYSALAAFYYSGTPSLSPDSLSALTIQTDPVPQDQQAWPIYQSVLRSCCDPQSARFLTASSDCPQSPELARWIDEHPGHLPGNQPARTRQFTHRRQSTRPRQVQF